MEKNNDYLQDIADIRTMMERSAKFLSLSGWAGTPVRFTPQWFDNHSNHSDHFTGHDVCGLVFGSAWPRLDE